ncbi:MAG: phosphate signaling complex protein PhoU [Acidobacteria bacterium]|nr:phosphate signaling complex protein PhoU [Acidobacteriota bacterium]MBI3662654.1 phosphate signaling complex protein PhoU [Acidobacteriota bacterium]
MATIAREIENFQKDALVNYLVSMARTVEGAVNRAIEALLHNRGPRASALAGEIFLNEPRVNEMEIVIDEHAVKMLRGDARPDEDIRMIVATLRINNDLERMGDLAVNIGQRVISLADMGPAETPPEFEPMSAAVRAMVSKSLGALIFRNVDLAKAVLQSDDAVDRFRDVVFERLLAEMAQRPATVAPNMQFVLASRYLERIADHCTNIAEDVVYWVRGLDIRHGRGRELDTQRPLAVAETTAFDSGQE